MKIFITIDYELFFGEKSGTVENCIIKPTQALLNIVDPYDIKLSVFIDAGYLIALEKFKSKYPELQEDYKKVTAQIKNMAKNGHAMELHIHPHWEDTIYNGKKWMFDSSKYKLSDFAEMEILDITTRYKNIIEKFSGRSPVAYRAGGWSVQPFAHIGKALKANSIFLDSSVFPKGHHCSNNQKFDFRKVERYNTSYNFSKDPAEEDPHGDFTEIPISSHKVEPFFFWRFVSKKLFKNKKHIAFGDGTALAMPKKEIIRLLFSPSYSVASIDGYKTSYINRVFEKYRKNTENRGNFVLIGHPKAFTPYSLKKLVTFIKQIHKNHTFAVYERQQ